MLLLAAEEHAARARCRSCGSPEIVSVCHHCGGWLCKADSHRAVDAANRPVSREFEDLGFDGKQVGIYHCAEHDHAVKGGLLLLVLIAAAVAVVGALVIAASLPVGLALLVLGTGVAVGAYVGHRRRLAEARRVRPALPVVPGLDSVSVRETIRGEVRLAEDGAYTSSAQPVAGAVTVAMTLTRQDRARLNDYRAKYGLTTGDLVEFSAGFAVFGGEAGLTFEDGHEEENRLRAGRTGLAFGGQVAGHPLFAADRGRSAGQWAVRFPYRLQPRREPGSIPLWIVPSLVPGSDRRTLQLTLDWAAFGGRRPGDESGALTFLRFEYIAFDVPADWGPVQRVEPTSNSVVSKSATGLVQTIKWRLLSPTEQDCAGRTVLRIRFEKPIGEADTVTGSLHASFRGSLSGITGVRMYWPVGGRSPQQPKASVTMEAQVRFALSLNSVRYQAVRVVPDQADEASGRIGLFGCPRVVPDHRTVIALTDKLSESGYYIKRVTGHPPRGGGHANLANRVWDIVGRQYNGVCPIDFHITIAGEEERQADSIYSNAGNATARLAVRGSYVDEQMKAEVEKVWDELREKVITGLEAHEAFAPGRQGDAPPGPGWMPPPAEPPWS
jgi:hypothetical protein